MIHTIRDYPFISPSSKCAWQHSMVIIGASRGWAGLVLLIITQLNDWGLDFVCSMCGLHIDKLVSLTVILCRRVYNRRERVQHNANYDHWQILIFGRYFLFCLPVDVIFNYLNSGCSEVFAQCLSRGTPIPGTFSVLPQKTSPNSFNKHISRFCQ